MSLEVVLAALHENPGDHLGWLAIADCLEEQGESERAELARLSALVRMSDSKAEGTRMMGRIRELLGAGIKPCVPTLTNSIGMTLALIPPGRFLMGSPESEEGRSEDEHQHEVEITRGFYLGIYPVTQEQYQRVMGTNPSHFTEQRTGKDSRRFPVECVTWEAAVAFCDTLNTLEDKSLNGHEHTLPSEAEWEYACRGPSGRMSAPPFHFGQSLTTEEANFGLDEFGSTCAIGSYPPNGWGLFDMHGNVWEWCLDWYGQAYYPISPLQDPPGLRDGWYRVRRGGGWINAAKFCRSASRGWNNPTYINHYVGFRLAIEPDRRS